MKPHPQPVRTPGKRHLARPYVYKCNRCKTRNSFIKPLEWYIRPKMCRHCKWLNFHVDSEAMRRRRARPCTCAGCHYPHRRGSSVCFENPLYGVQRWADDGGNTWYVDGQESDVPF